ncbi:MAG: YegS/Rv2252/BmrU family lipid kinase [Prevotellaceae bacterium]|jgi:YegS/Rv2252/BmrU family lipid kinase|nr:YegS/Rv2252/BmrU family lipid kinase [Prevotellaceae bacterium]
MNNREYANFQRKKISVIINPVAGTKSKKSIPEKIYRTVNTEIFDIQILYTERKGHATEIAAEAVKNKVDYVVAAGGDGTVNEVAKALINTDTVLGIIPIGSGNGLARDLHIPMNVNKSISVLNQNNIIKIDYGIANDKVFFCTCGAGFDAEVSEKVSTQSKRGIVMYIKNMICTFYHFEPEKYKITCAEAIFEDRAFVVTCANASQYGNNTYIAPNADVQDGKMNISIIKPLSALNVPRIMIQMMSKRLMKNSKSVELITAQATIEREKGGVMHLDGNAIYADKNINVSIVKQGLNVLVSKKIIFGRDQL